MKHTWAHCAKDDNSHLKANFTARKIFQKTNGFAQWAIIRQSLTMSYCVENLKQGRKPELTIFTSKKKNFPPGIFGKEVRCASCGKILTKGKTLRKTGYERTLFCPTRKKSPSHCKGAFISEKHLESAILHELKNLADRSSDDRVQIGICQDAQSADLIQERNRLKTAVELIEKEITAYEQRSRDLYLKRATDGMSIDDFNSALSRIRNDVDKLRLKSKRASSELLHLNESIAAESIRMETVLKAADFNHLDKTKVSMLIESVYVHKRDPKSGTQAIDITWKF